MEENKEKQITIDGKPVTQQEFQEQVNAGKHLVEDKDNPGNYRTLMKIKG